MARYRITKELWLNTKATPGLRLACMDLAEDDEAVCKFLIKNGILFRNGHFVKGWHIVNDAKYGNVFVKAVGARNSLLRSVQANEDVLLPFVEPYFDYLLIRIKSEEISLASEWGNLPSRHQDLLFKAINAGFDKTWEEIQRIL